MSTIPLRRMRHYMSEHNARAAEWKGDDLYPAGGWFQWNDRARECFPVFLPTRGDLQPVTARTKRWVNGRWKGTRPEVATFTW